MAFPMIPLPGRLLLRAALPLLILSFLSCAPEADAVADAPSSDAAGEVPTFEVDPFWPKELPNRWIIGEVRGLFVDDRDHVWVIHRPGNLTERELWAAQDPPAAECCIAAPPVVEFDPEGNVVQAWGGPPDDPAAGYVWPEPEHGIFLDHQGFVWIAGNTGHQILKFTREGRHVLTIGGADPGEGSNDPTRLGGPAAFAVNPETGELFVADGYINRRVVVYDAGTGEYKRHWGAYGERPEDGELGRYDPDAPPARQFRTAHGIVRSHDGLLYVSDRGNDRVQVFREDGAFVMERRVAPQTRGSGTAFTPALSHDPGQAFLYLMDGTNNKVRVLRRDGLEEVGQFGHAGRHAGQFLRAHVIGVDSEGNVFTGEAGDGKRVQKFRRVR